MVNGCQTKSVLDYLRAGGRGKGKGKQQDGDVSEKLDGGRNISKKKSGAKQKGKKEAEEVDELNRMVVRVLHVSEAPTALTVKVFCRRQGCSAIHCVLHCERHEPQTRKCTQAISSCSGDTSLNEYLTHQNACVLSICLFLIDFI